MKKILFFFLIVLAALDLFGAGNSETDITDENGVTSLRFTTWTGNAEQLDMLKSFTEGFNNSQDEFTVDVTFDTIPFQDYVQKITLQLAGSNPPDMGWIVESSAPTFVNSGVLSDLSAELSKYNYDDFSEPAMDLWVKDGETYGVPFSTSPFIVLYNKDMFEQAGVPTPGELARSGDWTWEKFREVSGLIRQRTGVYGFQTIDGQGYGGRVWHNLIPMMRGYGGDAWDEEGNVLINSPESVRGVQLFHDMLYRDKSVVPPGDLSDFYAGAAAMTIGQISRVSKLADVDWEWAIAPMPSGPAGPGSSDAVGQAAMVVFASSRKQAAARALLAYMTNEANVAAMSRYWPPARISVMSSPSFLTANPSISEEQMRAAVVPGLQNGRVLSYHEKFPEISLSASAEFDRLWNPDADVRSVLDAVAQAIRSQM